MRQELQFLGLCRLSQILERTKWLGFCPCIQQYYTFYDSSSLTVLFMQMIEKKLVSDTFQYCLSSSLIPPLKLDSYQLNFFYTGREAFSDHIEKAKLQEPYKTSATDRIVYDLRYADLDNPIIVVKKLLLSYFQRH